MAHIPKDAGKGTTPGSGRAGTGRRGEDAAARFLAHRGCSILARNWRGGPGEIDIVAACPTPGAPAGQTIIFAEVRTRHGERGLAEESISRRKAASMVNAAYAYMEQHTIDPEAAPWRIDLLAVAMQGERVLSINWIEGALTDELFP